jgi:hypothetical protein
MSKTIEEEIDHMKSSVCCVHLASIGACPASLSEMFCPFDMDACTAEGMEGRPGDHKACECWEALYEKMWPKSERFNPLDCKGRKP